MKFSPVIVLALVAQTVVAKKSSKKKAPKCEDVDFNRKPSYKFAYPVADYKHYLVCML